MHGSRTCTWKAWIGKVIGGARAESSWLSTIVSDQGFSSFIRDIERNHVSRSDRSQYQLASDLGMDAPERQARSPGSGLRSARCLLLGEASSEPRLAQSPLLTMAGPYLLLNEHPPNWLSIHAEARIHCAVTATGTSSSPPGLWFPSLHALFLSLLSLGSLLSSTT